MDELQLVEGTLGREKQAEVEQQGEEEKGGGDGVKREGKTQ